MIGTYRDKNAWSLRLTLGGHMSIGRLRGYYVSKMKGVKNECPVYDDGVNGFVIGEAPGSTETEKTDWRETVGVRPKSHAGFRRIDWKGVSGRRIVR